MIKIGILCSLLCVAIVVIGQDKMQGFKRDFAKVLDKNFSQDQLNKMFSEYRELLTPDSEAYRLFESLQGHKLLDFPLFDFRDEKLYLDNILNLLNSENPNQRILAYLVIASSYDISKESILLDKIKIEKNKGCLFWAGMALLYLKCNHTTELFDFLVKNENFGDAHMFPFYVQLDKDSLRQTAYKRIRFKDKKSKILAAQILSVTVLNSKTDSLLRESVQTWNMDIKGYAIYSIKELQMSNLLGILKPLLIDKRTRSISLEALANSPTSQDRGYLLNLVNKEDTTSEELLDCFYKSKNLDNIKYWLKLVNEKPIPKKYSFFVFEQPLIRSDSLLNNVLIALKTIRNKHVLSELVRALEGRSDDESLETIIFLLKNPNPSVRYWAALTVQNNTSEKLKREDIHDLIIKGLKDGDVSDD